MDDAPPPVALPAPPELMIWTSPMFPTGAFAFSHGLEWAVHSGTVADEASFSAWLDDLVAHGSLWNDLVVTALAFCAAASGDAAGLARIAELSAALQPSAERHLEAVTQGAAFVAAIDATWVTPRWNTHRAALGRDTTLPVAFAVACVARGIAIEPALQAHALGVVSNLCSTAIRLGVLGQTGAQRALMTLLPRLSLMAARAAVAGEDDLGAAAFAIDLASMHHETQPVRLFRS